MVNNPLLIGSIGVYFLTMILIGVVAYRRTHNISSYVLGNRTLGAMVSALSAGAADMSGWLMLGVPGAMFSTGLSSLWIVVGLAIGTYLNWLLIAPRLRIFTDGKLSNSLTIPGFFSSRFDDKKHILRLVSGIVIVIFFTLYVASGMAAGGVTFETILGLEYRTGIIVLAGVTIFYTFFGGFLAVSWTDFLQGLIMLTALVLVPIVAFLNVPTDILDNIRSVSSPHLDFFRGTSFLGVISLLAWGLGYFGMPHILVRFMAIENVNKIPRARIIGISWMVISTAGAMLTGLIGFAYFNVNNLSIDDPETIFIKLGDILFHPIITGFLVSAVLAAIMSTIASQLIVTASSITEDIYKSLFPSGDKLSERAKLTLGRVAVLVVSLVAISLSWSKETTVLSLVGYAWAGFGAAFGPVVIASLFWRKITINGALAGMIVGALSVIIWSNWIKQYFPLYELLPAFLLASITLFIFGLLDKPNDAAQKKFDQMQSELKLLRS